jgi:hypothetical protein
VGVRGVAVGGAVVGRRPDMPGVTIGNL